LVAIAMKAPEWAVAVQRPLPAPATTNRAISAVMIAGFTVR